MSINGRKRVLLTGGRAPVTLELARLFASVGHTVFVADSLRAQLTKSSKTIKKSFLIHRPAFEYEAFIEDLIKIIQEEDVDLLVPTCEEVFYVAKGKSQLESYCNVFCPDLPLLLQLHHKYEFIKQAEERGLLTPPSFLIFNKKELTHALEEIGDEAVLKPVYSRFGANVVFVNKNSMGNLQFPDGEYVVQKRIIGQPICSYSVFVEGELVAHTQYKVEFSAGNSASIHFQHIEHPKIESWVKRFFAEEKVTGQFAFDFIETSEGELFPLECNPRSTSGIHLFKNLPLADAFLGVSNTLLKPATDSTRMIGLAMLIYGWRKGGIKKWFKAFLQSKDIIWSVNDIKPFFYQFYSYTSILKLAFKIKKSPIEATTYDIEWNGDDV